ncbi:zinc-ribbon domain-containing protein, partial [Lysinibacillus fusiformis]|uniref:zinc-ribbon domain-containing protein n=2 Tax=Bacillati TaxID=1783272 RepID=UPI003823CE45
MTRRTRFLVNERPDIAAQWHPTLNGDLDRATIGPGSHRRVFWQCPAGHVWQAVVHGRVAGGGCPRCAGYIPPGSTNLAESFPELAAQWHPRNTLAADSVGPGSHRKVWWLCPHGHDFEARISSRRRGTGCPACGRDGTEPRPLRELADLAGQVDVAANPGVDLTEIFTNSSLRLTWKCARDHRWSAKVRDRAIAGSGCPHCAGRAPSPPLEEAHPALAAEWHPARNDGLPLAKITSGSHRVVWWQCGDCKGEFRARVFNRVRGTNRCPHCSRLVRYRDLATENPELAANWHPTLNGMLTPADVTAGSNQHVWWTCPRGHEPWQAIVAMVFLAHQACPGCRRSGISRQETDLFAELQHVLGGGVQQHRLRAATGVWRLDMVFPTVADGRVVVEFDGSYWHRNSHERDLRKALDVEQLRPGWTVVRV